MLQEEVPMDQTIQMKYIPIALVKMEVIRRRRETDTMFQEIQLNMDKIINRHNSTLKSWIHYCSNTS